MSFCLVPTGSQGEMCVWPLSVRETYNRTCNQKIPQVTQPKLLEIEGGFMCPSQRSAIRQVRLSAVLLILSFAGNRKASFQIAAESFGQNEWAKYSPLFLKFH